jgi:hypothetical protein
MTFLCKRHQMQHLEFCTTLRRTRRSGVRVPPGAPLFQLFEFIVLSIYPLLCFELSEGRAEASLLQGRCGGR